MKKNNFYRTSLFFVAIFLILALVTYFMFPGFWSQGKSAISGIDPEAARSIAPLTHAIQLAANPISNGVEIRWTSNYKVLVDNYFVIYRKTIDKQNETGWGKRVATADIKILKIKPYVFIDTETVKGEKYSYIVVSVQVSREQEIIKETSNTVEVVYP